MCLNDVADSEIFEVNVIEKSLNQYLGIHHLEEHYYPSSLTYGNNSDELNSARGLGNV